MVEKVSIGTATAKYKLVDKGVWLTVGSGPLLLMAGNSIVYALSDSIPDDDGATEGLVLLRGETMYIPLTKLVWVAARGDDGADVFVAGPEG